MGWVLEGSRGEDLISDSSSIVGLRCMPRNRVSRIVFPLQLYDWKEGLDWKIEGLVAFSV